MTSNELFNSLAQLVTYDPSSGSLTWKNGTDANTKHSKGYFCVKLGKNNMVLSHRLAWFIYYGYIPSEVDHIDRNKVNNAISNLREVTRSQNHMNKEKQSNNTSGYTGVARDIHGTKWQAYIKVRGKRIHLGVFTDIMDAVRARKEAVLHYFGEFAPDANNC